MTREETKQAMSVMQAHVDEQDIEKLNNNILLLSNPPQKYWELTKDPDWNWNNNAEQFRIRKV